MLTQLTQTVNKSPEFLVVIGASAGGLNALCEMFSSFTPGVDAAYCVVLHLSRQGIGDFVAHKISGVTSIPCALATDGEQIVSNRIYVARPNQHLLVKDGKFMLGSGPEENRWRPSIDVLFRSAAVSYNSHTIGIILSGLLDDGTSGMSAIKKCGGICITQDPNEAEYPDMVLSVINYIEVDHVTPLGAIGPIIEKIARESSKEKMPVPPELIAESRIAEEVAVGIEDVRELNVEQSVLACPDCGGGLWRVKDDLLTRYRCHIGHAYSERDLVLKQAEVAGSTLWVALRMMEERKHLLKKIEVDNTRRGYKTIVKSNLEKQKELEKHINHLKEILFDLQNHTAS
jgi:two-component system chemotaxis response regulator CheB